MALPSCAVAEHDEGADGVRQDVAEGDPEVPESHGARRLDVLHLADGQHAGADDPGRARNDRNRDGEDDVLDRRAERRGHDEGEDEERQSLQDVHDALGDEIGLAADVAGQEPDHAAEDRAEQGRRQADDERHPGAVDDARVDVAAEMIGAEPVLAPRRRQALRGVGGDRIVRRELIREDGGEHDHEHDRAAGRAEWFLPAEPREHGPRAEPSADRRSADRERSVRRSRRAHARIQSSAARWRSRAAARLPLQRRVFRSERGLCPRDLTWALGAHPAGMRTCGRFSERPNLGAGFGRGAEPLSERSSWHSGRAGRGRRRACRPAGSRR